MSLFPSRLSAALRWSVLALILAISGALMLGSSAGDSGIMDELAHVPAGYSYVRYFDYRLNPEHPPLVKMLAGLPLLFQGVSFPTDKDAWQKEVNSQWTAGYQFLYEEGNDADRMLFAARLGPIFLTLLLIVAIYLWSTTVIGRWWALLPAFLTALSPTILAHGHYVTTDIGATLGMFVATAAFLGFLFAPSRKKLIMAGLAFGFAQLLKYSAFLLIPYFFILMLVFYLVSVIRDWPTTDPAKGRFRRFGLRFYRYFRSLFVIFLIGFALVYVVYFFLTLNYPAEKQVSDSRFILSSFTPRFLPDFVIWLSGIPGLRPIGEYLLGLLMVLQRSSGGNTVYFLGEVTAAGSSLYFPLVFLMKEPLPVLILILFAFGYSVWETVKWCFSAVFRRTHRLSEYLTTNFSEFAMLAFIVIYWLSSVTSHLNIGVRHILPTLPFIYILTTEAVRHWFSLKNLDAVRNFAMKIFVLYQELVSVSVKTIILAILLLWFFLSSLFAYPHYLSYFNIVFGGATNGYRHVTDSNYDWGQDLKRLKLWADENLRPEEKIAVDYFGAGNAEYYLGPRAAYWWSSKGSPLEEGIGWLAVSINTIQGAKGKLADGQQRKPEEEYQWLKEPYKPFARAGKSIFIYKLDK